LLKINISSRKHWNY